jgi:bifunctional enzyme CysN/CysC
MHYERNYSMEDMNIVIVGHVDHGKSTVVGRLLADTDSLPQGKLERIRETCKRNSKPFEYAFLLDALKDEQAQGITIDAARCFFKTKLRNYLIIDAPGHTEFLKNMVTGASRAEAALLVIDAAEGIRENTRRHGYLLSMLEIRQVAVLVNKMDLVAYDRTKFEAIVAEYSEFLKNINIVPAAYIPVSGMKGDNIAWHSTKTPWFNGRTVLEELDYFVSGKPPVEQAFRLPVQGVYKFTRKEDARRIIAGTIESGRVKVGDEIVFYPSGKKSRIKSLETFNREKPEQMEAGWAAGFTLEEQIYVKRGDLVSVWGESQPKVANRIKVNLFWLGKEPLIPKKEYFLKLGTAKIGFRVEEICRVLDASTLQAKKRDWVGRHEVAECILKLKKPLAFDLAREAARTGRFVIIDNHEISGGGIVTEALEDKQTLVKGKGSHHNYQWERSFIVPEERAERYKQRATLIIITGQKGAGKKALAKTLEKKLFDEGKIVYFLNLDNVSNKVNTDLKKFNQSYREKYLRRLTTIFHIMLDAGVIGIITVTELTCTDLEIIKAVIDQSQIETVWIGEEISTDIGVDLQISGLNSEETAVSAVKELLEDHGVIFKAW